MKKRKFDDLFYALLFGTQKNKTMSNNNGIEIDEVLNLYRDGKMAEPFVAANITIVGDIECIKVLQTSSYNQLEFIVNQFGSPIYQGTLYYSPEDDTIKNWNVFRSFINRGSKLFYPLSHIYEKLEMQEVNEEIERIIKFGMKEFNEEVI
jgi:hypothetical protein